MRQIFSLIFSNYIMSIIILIFAISMAIGTFIEQIYSTSSAKSLVYESIWFEILMVLLIFFFIINIKRYHLWKKEKWPLLIFHFAFILIFLGGAISRYIGFEGIISIREGNSSQRIVSEKTFIKLQIFKNNYVRFYKIPYLLAPLHSNLQKKIQFKKDIFKLKIINYTPNAREIFIKNLNGKPLLKIIAKNIYGNIENYLEEGHLKNFGKIFFSFGKYPGLNTLQIYKKNKKLYLLSPFKISYTILNKKSKKYIQKGIPSELNFKAIYQIGSLKWIIPYPIRYGTLKYISVPKSQKENFFDAITIKIINNNLSDTFTFFGKKGQLQMNDQFLLGNNKISIGYGSILIYMPFILRLNHFEIKYYPGSSNPSSFTSDLTIIDGNHKKNKRIFMNNVIDYKGYRFFQSGYDPDIKGTYLSVNHDYWGTFISYIGYGLFILGMFLIFFWKGTRFWKLKSFLSKISQKKILFFIFLFSFFLNTYSNNISSLRTSSFIDSKKINLEKFINSYPRIPKYHLNKFSRCLIQDQAGRIKPIHTIALELLRKIYKKDHINNWSPVQWIISIHQDPILWTKLPFIKVDDKRNYKLLKITKANKNNYTSLINLYHFNHKTNKIDFILQKDYEKSLSKNPIYRNKYDKSIIDLNERLGIVLEIFQGKYLKIFPIPKDSIHTWTGWIKSDMNINPIALKMLNNYFISLNEAQKLNYWKKADFFLEKIINYQKYYGRDILPSSFKINTEIFYNNANIFYRIILIYFLLGSILLLLSFINLFFFSFFIKIICRIIVIFIGLTFLLHTFGLGLRWYISEHAPWSNGYESAVFISWCMILSNWIFYRKKNFFIPSIASLSSTILLVIAHSNLMNPEISNLMPVLKSYWLIIHVAIITSSYGFFSVGGFLGLTVLILYVLEYFIKRSISRKIIKELTIINEMSLTVGLFLLTVGTFLGGIWANESWGRYWSWDPKETWALISIMIYVFVLHMRMIPSLRSIFAFNFASIISLSSIIMTYFGVNYYLSGLHSYAKGDSLPIPFWIYYIIFFIFFIGIIARYQIRKSFFNDMF